MFWYSVPQFHHYPFSTIPIIIGICYSVESGYGAAHPNICSYGINVWSKVQRTQIFVGCRAPDFEQLFNLSDDPGEKLNLIADKEYSIILNALREKVADYSMRINSDRESYLKENDCAKR